ncbi:MAG: YqiA/YcfP family alpha/beta fold hydrolase [Verrucomicrobiota bacterium]
MRYLYLHGFGSGPSSAKAQFFKEQLAQEGLELEIPELVPGDFSALSMTGMLAVLEAQLGGAPSCLIGSSLGGFLAALYASQHETVERLVLLAPAFGFPRRWRGKLGEEAFADWRSSGRLKVWHYASDREAEVGFQLYQDGLHYLEEPEVRQATLVIHGRQDETVPVEWSRRWSQGKENVSYREVESDHSLTDVLDGIAPEVISFLTS